MKRLEVKIGKQTAYIDAHDASIAQEYYWATVKVRNNRYVVLYKRENNKTVYAGVLHRMIMQPPDDMVVDHIDGNGLNNCRANLRVCTKSENLANLKTQNEYKQPKSGFFGVCENRGKFTFEFTINKKRTRKGGFSTALEAAKAREIELHRVGNFYARSNKQRIADHDSPR